MWVGEREKFWSYVHDCGKDLYVRDFYLKKRIEEGYKVFYILELYVQMRESNVKYRLTIIGDLFGIFSPFPEPHGMKKAKENVFGKATRMIREILSESE